MQKEVALATIRGFCVAPMPEEPSYPHRGCVARGVASSANPSTFHYEWTIGVWAFLMALNAPAFIGFFGIPWYVSIPVNQHDSEVYTESFCLFEPKLEGLVHPVLKLMGLQHCHHCG